jgi:hypothetical protein
MKTVAQAKSVTRAACAGFICTIACWGAAAVAQDGAAKGAAWKDYSYPDDAFVIAAPAEPKVSREMLRVFGGSASAHIYTVKGGEQGALIVVVEDRQPADQRSDQDVLEQARLGVLATAHAIVTVQQNRTLGDHRGAQIDLEAADSGGARKRVRDRFFVVGRRLYQIMAIGPAGDPLPADAERWFASFRLANDGDGLRPSLR